MPVVEPFIGWTVKEYAALWGVHPDRVRRWIRAGRLGCLQPSARCTRIPPEAHEAFKSSVNITVPAEREAGRERRRRGGAQCR